MSIKHTIGKLIMPMLPVNKRLLDIIRFEVGCWWQRMGNFINPFYHYKIYKLKKTSDLLVNFGTGGRGLPGWVNIDARSSHKDLYIAYDVRRRLPFANNSVRCIFIEHVIEHLDFESDIPNVFSEFLRILKPGGLLRIIVPDTERFVIAYALKSEKLFLELNWDLNNMPFDIFTPMHILNHIFHQKGEHLFGWDFETMSFSLSKAGFSSVSKKQFKSSSNKLLEIDQENHSKYSLYVEASK